MIYPDSFEHKTGFDSIREMVKSRCLTTLGAVRCDEMAFSNDYAETVRKLRSTAEMLSIITGEEDLGIAAVHDVTAHLQAIKVPGTYIPANELYRTRTSLAAIAGIAEFFKSRRNDDGHSPYPCLDNEASGLSVFPGVIRSVDKALDRFGNVKDNASPELARLRNAISGALGSINSTMRRILSQAAQSGYIEADTAPSIRDGRLVIPVAPMHKRKINGIVHDESASGKTIYIEPAEIVEANNRIRELQMEERHEIIRILTAIADEIRPYIPEMLATFEIVGTLDFIRAKAIFASETGGKLPTISPKPEIEWYHACHPVLLLSLRSQNKEIVPLDISLDSDHRLLIISGPNAGGKSVTLKTVGIVQY
ncbi:MAG: endonuclease MutS2, partial [Muribaculaceae bacterium]|nr:endonuclease MutS2 [Muribaculaceae bacterium]